ncbi:MAG TPA: carboxyl transferase domain-containing protein [Syntrophales bacterium]|nr:carboxyl transferase domain-containing protein [Syntrophales bacterium]
MKEIEKMLHLLNLKKRKVCEGGGIEAQERQKRKKKNTARERIGMLADRGTFYEYDMFIKNRSTDFNLQEKDIPAEGIIAGHCFIDGRPVYLFSQDFTVMGGSLGEAHAAKMCNLMDMAVENGCPIIGINDSGGARIQEGMGALNGYCSIFYKNTMASGIVPQLSIIMGPCAGGAVYSPSLTDFIFMVKDTSLMFITGPDVIKAVTGETIDSQDLGGCQIHGKITGVAHFVADNEEQCLALVSKLLSYLPSNSGEKPPIITTNDKADRMEESLRDIVPIESKKPYDVKKIIKLISDDQDFLEVHTHFARNIVVGFARFNGMPVGIIANQAMHMAGCLDTNASVKAARFIRFCDTFNFPLLTFADAPGYLPGSGQEHGGIIRHGAKLLYAYSEATVPKITVVLRKDYGGAYSAMCGKALGADYVMAFPTAEIAVMGPEGAINILYKNELTKDPDFEHTRQEKITEYRKLFANPYKAAEWGLVNEIIDPSELRPRIISLLEFLKNKKDTSRVMALKKHGNIPL